MRVRRSKSFIVVLFALLVAGAAVTVAAAAVISQQVYAEGDGGLHYRFEKRTTDASGFDSGWHIHPGLAIVQVESGSFQIYQGSCTPKTVNAGETFIEVPWKPVRAVATGSITWTTSLLVPSGQQLLIPLGSYNPQQPNPCP
jgi:hypothetical protein